MKKYERCEKNKGSIVPFESDFKKYNAQDVRKFKIFKNPKLNYNEKSKNKLLQKTKFKQNFKMANSGITIVALIIMIIIILILAGITVSVVTRSKLVDNAKEAKHDSTKSQIIDWLSQQVVKEQSKNPLDESDNTVGKVRNNIKDSIENEIGDIVDDKNSIKVGDLENRTNDDGETEKHFEVEVDGDKYDVDINGGSESDGKDDSGSHSGGETGGKEDKLKPTTTKPTIKEVTSSTITVKCNQTDPENDDKNGKKTGIKEYTYYLLDENGTVIKQETTTTNTYTFENLEPGKTYKVKTSAEDGAGNKSESQPSDPVTTLTIPDANKTIDDKGTKMVELSRSPEGWTNQDVTVRATSHAGKGYTVQMRTYDDATGKWSDWKDTKEVVMTGNGKVEARLADKSGKYGNSTSMTINDIDKSKPSDTAPKVTTTTNSATVELGQTDNNLKDKNTKIEYAISEDGTTWKDWQESNKFDNLTQGKTYYFKTKVTDPAGNVTESKVTQKATGSVPDGTGTTNGKANLSLSAKPTTPTNQNVTVTATTPLSGYTIELSTNGVNYEEKTSIELTANATVYARLKDSTGQTGRYTSLTVNNIDKLPPTNTAPTVTDVQINSITVRCNQVDQEAQNGYTKSGLNGSYKFILKDQSGKTIQEKIATTSTYTFTGLTQDTQYAISTEVTDNAKNTTTSTTHTGDDTKTKEVPSGEKEGVLTLKADMASWTNQDVTVSATTSTTGFYIEMAVGTPTNFTRQDKNAVTVDENTNVYARLADNAGNKGKYATYVVSNIDKVAPNTTAPGATVKTDEITVTLGQDDSPATTSPKHYAKSGLAYTQTKYRIKQKGGNYGEWQACTQTKAGYNTFTFKKGHGTTGLTPGTTYVIQTMVQDNTKQANPNTAYGAGNDAVVSQEKEVTTLPMPDANANGILNITGNPTNWTNQNVTIKVDKENSLQDKPHYKLQIMQDGGNWTDASSFDATSIQTTVENNKNVYVRLVDPTGNVSSTKTIPVTYIDKLKPTTTAPTLTSTTNTITATFNQQDQNATSQYGESGLKTKEYAIRIDGGSYGNWQTSNTFENLKQNTKYYVKTRATDNAGNVQESAESSITTKTVPNGQATGVITLSADHTTWTNTNVIVTADTNQDKKIYTIQVSTDGSTFKDGTSVTLTGNGSVYARLRDDSNNYGVASQAYKVTIIDKIKPNTTAPTLTSTTNTITATFNQNDSNETKGNAMSGLKTKEYAIRVDDGNYGNWQGSNTFENLKQNTKYYVKTRATDNAGNVQESTESNITTKGVPGGTGITSGKQNIVLTPSITTWTNQNVTVTATTNVSGYTLQVSKDETNYSDGSTLTFDANGTAYARLRDSSNNYGGAATLKVGNIDKTPPSAPTYRAYYSDGGASYTSGTWTNKQVQTDISSVDAGSGIAYMEYSFDNSKWTKFNFGASNGIKQSGTTFTGTEVWGLTDRNDTVYIRATDKVGYTTTATVTFNIRYDLKGPTAPIITNSSGGNWTNQNVTISLDSSDSASGVAKYQVKYSNTGGQWIDSKQTDIWSAERNETVSYRAIDNFGNIGEESSTDIKIDKTKPSAPSITNSSNGNWTNQNITTKVSSTDSGGSGVAKYQLKYSNSNNQWRDAAQNDTWSAERSETVYYRAVDNAGNESDASSTGIHIDKTAPTIGNFQSTEVRTYKITLSGSCSDNASGIASSGYQILNDSGWSNTQSSGDFSGLKPQTNYTFRFVATDKAGNTSYKQLDVLTMTLSYELFTVSKVTCTGNVVKGYYDDYFGNGTAYVTVTPKYSWVHLNNETNGSSSKIEKIGNNSKVYLRSLKTRENLRNGDYDAIFYGTDDGGNECWWFFNYEYNDSDALFGLDNNGPEIEYQSGNIWIYDLNQAGVSRYRKVPEGQSYNSVSDEYNTHNSTSIGFSVTGRGTVYAWDNLGNSSSYRYGY